MIDPSKYDDDWAELARELERDKPTPPQPTTGDSPAADIAETPGEVELQVHLESTVSEEFEEPLDDGPETDGESIGADSGTGDAPSGTGRKRRRRRRRKKKGGQPAENGGSEETEKFDSPEDESEEAGPAERVIGETDYLDEPADEIEDDSMELSGLDTDEDAGGELLRELIANWNVPSWDDVVSGLYRPDR